MTVEYVDAGEAVDQGRLSGKVAGGEVAPPVVRDVNYDRILLTTRAHWLCCDTCGRLSTYNLIGICQSAECSG